MKLTLRFEVTTQGKFQRRAKKDYPSMLSWPCEMKKRNLGPGYNPTKSQRNLVWGKYTQTTMMQNPIGSQYDRCALLYHSVSVNRDGNFEPYWNSLLLHHPQQSEVGEERSELPREAKIEGECEDLDWKRRSGRKNTMDMLTTTGNVLKL